MGYGKVEIPLFSERVPGYMRAGLGNWRKSFKNLAFSQAFPKYNVLKDFRRVCI